MDVSFSHDGALIAGGSNAVTPGGFNFKGERNFEPGKVAIWDAATGIQRAVLPAETANGKKAVYRVDFDKDPERVWVQLHDFSHLVHTLDWPMSNFREMGSGQLFAVIPDRHIIVAGEPGQVGVRSTQGFEVIRPLSPQPEKMNVWQLAVDSAHEQMAVCFTDNLTKQVIQRHAVATGRVQGTYTPDLGISIYGMAYEPGGKRLLLLAVQESRKAFLLSWDPDRDGPEKLVTTSSSESESTPTGTLNGRGALCALPDGRRVAILNRMRGEVHVWDLASNTRTEVLTAGGGRTLSCLAVSPRGDRAAAGCTSSGEVFVWQLK